jgi:DNA-binding beta-propeller fold protein YncE
MACRARFPLTALAVLTLLVLVGPACAEVMIIGNDEKVGWDDTGKTVFGAPGKDTVTIVDITNREAPRIVTSLSLMNSIFGPPTNLAITPDEKVALVANSMDWAQDGAGWKAVPDDKIYVIDLTQTPPKHVATVQGGKQPSGMAINARGDLALVTNRADSSITVLSIRGTDVKVVGTVPMGDQVAAVAITPDGKRALAVKFPAHKVAVLDIAGDKVTYAKYDMPAGLWPYNVDVTPNGKLALTADNGNSGSSDGHVDTVSVIDLEATPPRVIDRVVVGDAPEGFAISPTGDLAVAVLLNGSAGVPKNAWFANKAGKLAVLKIDGKKVVKVQDVEVGGLPEGLVWSPDGKYLYVGNFTDSNVSILRVEAGKLVDTGKKLQLPGHPASMRGRAR